MKNKKSKALIVKSNEMIEASYKLTLQEQRIILYMASKIMPDDEDFKPVRLYIDEFLKMIQVDGKSKHKEIEEITNKLRKRDLIIKKPESTLQIGWLSSAEYFYGKGFVELEFSPKLKPYLLQLKERFTKYQLASVIRLKHSYSIRIYELLKQYETIGWRYFVLEELKQILGITPDEYNLYSNFKLKILRPVKKEFDLKYTTRELDFTFEYEEKKEGRKVIGLKFKISKPPIQIGLFEAEPVDDDHDCIVDALEAELMAMKLTKKQIALLMKKFNPGVIRRNIDHVQQKISNNEIKNIPAYLFDAISGDYASTQINEYDPHLDNYKKKASVCWSNCKGGCAAIWENHKDNKLSDCHYCKKFDEQRAIA